MTLLEEVQAKADPAYLVHPRRDYEIWQAVNAGRVRAGSFEGGIGSILRALGADAGGAFLDALEQAAQISPAIKWSMKLIVAGTFDFGDAEARARIDAMATQAGGNLLTAEQAAALKALAEVPDPVSLDDISSTLNAAGIGMPPPGG